MARLNHSVARFFSGEVHEEVREVDPDSGYIAHKIRITRKVPESWRRLTYHALTDIRHSVDQAMYAAVAFVSDAVPDRDIYFPWARSPADLEHHLHERRRGIPEALHPVIRRLEPYPRGDGYTGGDDTVFAVRDIAGPNKHRFTITPCARFTGMALRVDVQGDWLIPFDGWNAAKNEFVILLVEPAAEGEYKFDFEFGVAFGDVERIAGKPVIPILDWFGRYAQFAMLELVKEVARIRGV